MGPGKGRAVCFSFRVRGELTNHSLILGGRDKKKMIISLHEVLTLQPEMQGELESKTALMQCHRQHVCVQLWGQKTLT